jgi:hypothetical protein
MNDRATLISMSRNNKSLVGLTNLNGLKFVSGPYKQYGKLNNATAWGLLCPICSSEFVTVTNVAVEAKTCYGCRYDVKKSYSEESTWKHLYSALKGRKQSKKFGCTLTFDEFVDISQQPCYYCGLNGYAIKGHREWSAYVKGNGIDRVDSLDGYHKHNVVPCCRTCNVAKSNMSRKEFLAWVQRIAKHNSL